MKIVHVMDWYIPGMGYQENVLPYEQKKLGYDVEIVTTNRLPAYSGYNQHVGKLLGKRQIQAGIFFDQGVKIHRLPTLFEWKLHGFIISYGLIRRLIKLKPDIVQAHGATSFNSLITIFFSKMLHYKVFVDDHSHSNNFKINSFSKKVYILFIKEFYKLFQDHVSFWLPVTEASKGILRSQINILSDNMEIMPLGVNNDLFYKSDSLRKKGRLDLSLKDQDLVIITAGKFSQSKDIDILIKAFYIVFQKNQDVKLLLVGTCDARYSVIIKQLITSLKLSTNVIFKDFVKNQDLPQYFNLSDIGIWPGDHSITAIESIATGLPIIIPENNPAYDVLLRNKAALDFSRGDPVSLSQKIEELLYEDQLRNEIMKNSQILVNKELSWKKIAEKSIEIYNRK